MKRCLLVLGVPILMLSSGCGGPARRAATAPSLSPQAQRVLEQAISRARPAYPTQDEALRAGVYRSAPPVLLAGAPAPPASPDIPARTAPPAPDPPRADPAPSVGPATADAPPPAGRPYVIQVAALRDGEAARNLLEELHRRFPQWAARVEEADDGLARVVVHGWDSAWAAERALPEVRELYPGAWIRRAAVP